MITLFSRELDPIQENVLSLFGMPELNEQMSCRVIGGEVVGKSRQQVFKGIECQARLIVKVFERQTILEKRVVGILSYELLQLFDACHEVGDLLKLFTGENALFLYLAPAVFGNRITF